MVVFSDAVKMLDSNEPLEFYCCSRDPRHNHPTAMAMERQGRMIQMRNSISGKRYRLQGFMDGIPPTMPIWEVFTTGWLEEDENFEWVRLEGRKPNMVLLHGGRLKRHPTFFLGSPMPIGAYGDDEVLCLRTPDKVAEAASAKVLADAEAMAMALEARAEANARAELEEAEAAMATAHTDEELLAVAEAPVAKAILDKEVLKRRLDEAAAESEAKKPRKT